jgi:hypothetical protein
MCQIPPQRAGARNTFKEPAGGVWGILNKKTEDSPELGLNNWLEIQEQAVEHDRCMKLLAVNHVRAQGWSVQTGSYKDVWDELEPKEQVTTTTSKYLGPFGHPAQEYGLRAANMMASMNMLKRSDMWIADSGASNHVTFSDLGCVTQREATGLTHRIVDRLVHLKFKLDIPFVNHDKDGNHVGDMTITDVSHLPEIKFNLFSLTRLQKKV